MFQRTGKPPSTFLRYFYLSCYVPKYVLHRCRSAGQLLRTLRVAGQLPAVPAKYPVSSLADGIAAKGSFDLLQYELDFYQVLFGLYIGI